MIINLAANVSEDINAIFSEQNYMPESTLSLSVLVGFCCRTLAGSPVGLRLTNALEGKMSYLKSPASQNLAVDHFTNKLNILIIKGSPRH